MKDLSIFVDESGDFGDYATHSSLIIVVKGQEKYRFSENQVYQQRSCLCFQPLFLIKVADYLIDMGPGGGEEGGRIVASGTLQEVKKAKESVTARYLS